MINVSYCDGELHCASLNALVDARYMRWLWCFFFFFSWVVWHKGALSSGIVFGVYRIAGDRYCKITYGALDGSFSP